MSFDAAWNMWTDLLAPNGIDWESQGSVLGALDRDLPITDDVIGEYQQWSGPEHMASWNEAFPG